MQNLEKSPNQEKKSGGKRAPVETSKRTVVASPPNWLLSVSTLTGYPNIASLLHSNEPTHIVGSAKYSINYFTFFSKNEPGNGFFSTKIINKISFGCAANQIINKIIIKLFKNSLIKIMN